MSTILSVIIPVFNEAESFHLLLDRLEAALHGIDWEVIFVNDGSTDATVEMIRSAAGVDPRVKLIGFSRNFGHQAAITAGLDFAEGDAVAIMDADLQDPPELLPRMLELMQQGYDVVSPRRVSREGDTIFKKWTAAVFYQMMKRLADKRITEEVGDFRMFSRRAVLAMRSFREHHRFMRGLVAWLGLKEVVVPFERQTRVAGTTKYPLFKMLRFAWTAISSFSALPLRLSIAAGLAMSGAGVLYMFYVLYQALWTKAVVPGWASIVVLQCVFCGMILLALGVIGDYVARTYEETKGRPLYIVSQTMNVEIPENGIARAALMLSPDAIPAPFFDLPLSQLRRDQAALAAAYRAPEFLDPRLPHYERRGMPTSSLKA